MKKMFVGVILVVCSSLIVSSGLCWEDITDDDMVPEDGMEADYEPEDVGVPDDPLLQPSVPINESEIEEKDDLENDMAVEDSDVDSFEDKIGSIEADEDSLSQESAGDVEDQIIEDQAD